MKAKRILSLDGGGIRGLVTCAWLGGVEEALARSGKPGLMGSFDLVAGTSTGALVACGLGIGLGPDAMSEVYRSQRDQIFPGMANRLWSRAGRFFSAGPSAPKYDGKGLDKVLRKVFGKTTLGQLKLPTLITSYDTISRKPVIFKSFKPSHRDLLVWEVCRASTAAPTYFPAHPMKIEGKTCALIDGGIVANNPTMCAIAEALRYERGADRCEELVVLSIGTGERTRPISLESAREWGALEWAVPIIDVLFDGNAESVDYITRQMVGDSYFRMQAELLAGLDDLDDTSSTNIAALEHLASAYLNRASTQTQLKDLIKLL